MAAEVRLIEIRHHAARFEVCAENTQGKARAHCDCAVEESALHTLPDAAEQEGGLRLVLLGGDGEAAQQSEVAFLVRGLNPDCVREIHPRALDARLELREVAPRADFAEPEDVGIEVGQCPYDARDRVFRLGRRSHASAVVPSCLKREILQIPRDEGDVFAFRLRCDPDGRRERRACGCEDGEPPAHGGSGGFVRLLLGSLLDVEGRRGLLDLAVEFLARLAEFIEALAEPAGEFGEALGPEQHEDDEQDEKDLRPTGRAEGE